MLPEGIGEAEVTDFVEGSQATKVKEVNATLHFGLTREVAWELGPFHIHYAEEHPYGVRFVMVTGEDRSDVDGATDLLARFLQPVSADDLLRAVDEADSIEDRRASLVRAGVGAPLTLDEPFFRRITDAMCDRTGEIREGGLWAAVYAFWPELLPLIAEMGTSDPEESLRDQAASVADLMRREGGGQ
ncbi:MULTISPECIES: hypothetical protein [Streptomycetaceae]|uniref:hypothetical protein n=1 Tax=Streptomycetaceae TaxID=2062 RepID=UPI00093C3658|nr:hypothetical protein [Streptomyces sp. CB02056]OKH97884.1 hypothetical protein AMK13_37310 [Streptomyces sp. CB02056]